MRKRQLGPYFNAAYVTRMEPKILQFGILGLKSKWDSELAQNSSGSIETDYSHDFMLATLDTISALAFGTEPRGLKENDPTVAHWVDATVKVHGSSLATATSPLPARRRLLTEGGKKPVDLLQAFLDAQDPESKISMDETQLQAETIVMMLAGTDTSSNTLQWATHLLMLYPEIRAKAVDEVRSNFATDHVITYAEVKKSLPFVEACIYEALRLCPVLGGTVPRVSPPGGITLQGHFIPAGTEINVNYVGASIHKNTWDEPLKYDPTSPGVRICPGRHLAWAEVSTILANMLKDYDMSLPDDYTHLGPDVLDGNGYPKLMESVHIVVTTPVNPQRDCRLVLTKRA
ncbi:cytochrome P450 [Linderina pennispora]|uniref:Cytochrome P450 n=1 Tax=Linderina pennispora TaxID=61395 RepID=A0A1Y1WHM8_9FUNG|nr:cytochrome P450 [Linderina pennispora]ORX73029.1 cytochrome P450 [Linderina pennispora]